jgi:XTP/dITP diphosphohydrolase
MQKLLLATTNPGKQLELAALLADLPVQLVTPQSIQIDLHVAETGSTYLENARLKALGFCQVSGLLSLADDTGLEVDALDGAPGLYSARFIDKPHASDQDRRNKLLYELQALPRPWSAHFTCSAVLIHPDGRQWIGSGQCQGEIIPVERGVNGFGYDPIFLLQATNKTMAELNMIEKNALSHRSFAIKDLLSGSGNFLDLFNFC